MPMQIKHNPTIKFLSVLIATLFVATAVFAESESSRRPQNAEVIDNVEVPPLHDLPALPTGKTKEDFLRDSKVTTRKEKGETVTEYRLKGRLYKIVVKPANAPAYTLIDEKGEGKFVRMGEATPKISVPTWVLLSW